MIIRFHKKFVKLLDKLSPAIQLRTDVRLRLFIQDPFHPTLNNHELHHPYEGCRSINISGDIRAIYKSYPEYIQFRYIGTHSELYK